MSEETNQQPPKREGRAFAALGLFILDLLKVLIIALVIVLPIRYFVAQPFVVSGSSMQPNFHDGEYLIIDELSYHTGNPERGDIIVFKYPKDTSEYFIKRVIGLPGERVVIKEGHVYIYNAANPNGMELDETYLPAGTETLVDTDRTLGDDEFFVLGDNRPASSDSRFWGPVPRSDIVGRVVLRAYPFNVFSTFSHITYSNSN